MKFWHTPYCAHRFGIRCTWGLVCRYSPQEVKDMVSSTLFSGAPVKPGVFKK